MRVSQIRDANIFRAHDNAMRTLQAENPYHRLVKDYMFSYKNALCPRNIFLGNTGSVPSYSCRGQELDLDSCYSQWILNIGGKKLEILATVAF